MKKFKLWEKLVYIFLTPFFICSFFFSIVATLKTIEEDPRFLLIGVGVMALNVGAFFILIKIARKYYDYHNEKGARRFFYFIIALPLIPAVWFLMYYGRWHQILVMVFMTYLYARIVEKEFGRLRYTIKKKTNAIKVGEITSFNSDVKIVGKNKKVKSSTDVIKAGDIITFTRGSETILSVTVNSKK